MVKPISLKPRKSLFRPRKPHRQDLCEKCKSLGKNCCDDLFLEEEEEAESDVEPVTSQKSSPVMYKDDDYDFTPVGNYMEDKKVPVKMVAFFQLKDFMTISEFL